MEAFSTTTTIWKLFAWLPSFLLKWFFSKERLANQFILDIQPRHTGVRIDLGEISDFDIYFRIVNTSPFTIELDRMEIDLFCAGTKLKTYYMKRTSYKPGETAMLFADGQINTSSANQISRLYEKSTSRIELNCEFNCPTVQSFPKHNIVLDGLNIEFINAEYRKKQNEPIKN